MSIKRVKLMRGVEAERFFAVPVQGEPIMTTDELKLYLGDGNKAGGFMVNADNTIAVWPDQTDATKKLSLAWWIAYFNGNEATIRIPRGTHEVLYDMTIPENICLKFDKGAIIEVADTKTLTINGAIEAGLWQIFSGAGNITGHISNEGIYIEWFGAVPDYDIALKTGTDNASAINKTLTFAKYANVKATSGAGNYKVDSTVTINCNVDMSQMTIYADGNTVNPVILFGSLGTVDQGSRLKARLPQVINYSKPSNGWDNSSVGIRLASANQCDIDIIYVYGFCHGVLCGGVDAGFAYNSIHIQMIYGNKRNLVLCAGFGETKNGWCNENVFYNGRFGFNTSDTNDYTGTRSIVLERVSGSIIGHPNNNLFVKPSVESENIEYSIEIAGSYNTFLNPRYEGEGGSRVLLKFNNRNLFIGGYTSPIFTTVAGIEQNQYVNMRGNAVDFQLSKLSSNSISGSSGWEFATFTNKNVFEENKASALIRNGTLSLRINTNETETPDVVLGMMAGPRKGLIFNGASPNTEGALGFYLSGGDICCQGTFLPKKNIDSTNGNYTLGKASYKWDAVYAVNGTIQTSDERAKTEISAIPDEWLDAWAEVDYTRFKMIDAVQKKGSDNARWHVGIIAQRVKEIFEARGLDAMKIGLLCYDEWDDIYEDIEVIDSNVVLDEEGNIITPEVKHTETVHSQTAGNLYSIRYDEVLTMEAAYMRREVERLKSSINV